MSEKIIIIGGSGAIGKAFVEFYKEQNSSNIVYSFSRSNNPVDNENITEKFIIGSGSLIDNKVYMSNGRVMFLTTPEKTIILKNTYKEKNSEIEEIKGILIKMLYSYSENTIEEDKRCELESKVKQNIN